LQVDPAAGRRGSRLSWVQNRDASRALRVDPAAGRRDSRLSWVQNRDASRALRVDPAAGRRGWRHWFSAPFRNAILPGFEVHVEIKLN